MALASDDPLDSDDEISQLARMGMFGDSGFQTTTTVADSLRKKKNEDEDYDIEEDLKPSKRSRKESNRKRKRKTMAEDETSESSIATMNSTPTNPSLDPIISSSQTSSSTTGGNSSSPISKRRKKARAWSADEEARYLEGLELFGRDWSKLVTHVGSRDAGAIRSHTQLHFLKLLKQRVPLPAKVAESGAGFTLSGKPLNKYSSTVLRVFGSPSEVPNIEGVISDEEEAQKHKFKNKRRDSSSVESSEKRKKSSKSKKKRRKKDEDSDESSDEFKANFARMEGGPLRRSTRERTKRNNGASGLQGWSEGDPFNLRTEMEPYGAVVTQPYSVSYCPNALLLADLHCHLFSENEVMGFLAGCYDSTTRHVHVARAVPLKEEMSNSQEVSACAVSQIQAVNEILEAGMVVVGWYHSHPTFDNFPSNRDCEQHWSHSSGTECPYVGLIVGSWSSIGECSDYRWFNIERESMSDLLPYQLNVEERITLQADDLSLFACMESLIQRYSKEYAPAMRTNLSEVWRDSLKREDKILISLKSHMRVEKEDLNVSALCGKIMTLFRRHKSSWFGQSESA